MAIEGSPPPSTEENEHDPHDPCSADDAWRPRHHRGQHRRIGAQPAAASADAALLAGAVPIEAADAARGDRPPRGQALSMGGTEPGSGVTGAGLILWIIKSRRPCRRSGDANDSGVDVAKTT